MIAAIATITTGIPTPTPILTAIAPGISPSETHNSLLLNHFPVSILQTCTFKPLSFSSVVSVKY